MWYVSARKMGSCGMSGIQNSMPNSMMGCWSWKYAAFLLWQQTCMNLALVLWGTEGSTCVGIERELGRHQRRKSGRDGKGEWKPGLGVWFQALVSWLRGAGTQGEEREWRGKEKGDPSVATNTAKCFSTSWMTSSRGTGWWLWTHCDFPAGRHAMNSSSAIRLRILSSSCSSASIHC